MLNCSSESDYSTFVEDLKRTLRKRGYPTAITEAPSNYNEKHRLEIMQNLNSRAAPHGTINGQEKKRSKDGDELLVFKCDFNQRFHKLMLHREFRKLLRHLRTHLGDTFLSTGRLVIAHPVHTNAFLDTHAYNFPHDKEIGCGKKRVWSGSGAL